MFPSGSAATRRELCLETGCKREPCAGGQARCFLEQLWLTSSRRLRAQKAEARATRALFRDGQRSDEPRAAKAVCFRCAEEHCFHEKLWRTSSTPSGSAVARLTLARRQLCHETGGTSDCQQSHAQPRKFAPAAPTGSAFASSWRTSSNMSGSVVARRRLVLEELCHETRGANDCQQSDAQPNPLRQKARTAMLS